MIRRMTTMTRITNQMYSLRWISILRNKLSKPWSTNTMRKIHVPTSTVAGCISTSLRSYSTSQELNMDNGNGSNKVQSLTKSENDQFLNVTWNDGSVTRYPYIWLRDNCRCTQCYDSDISERLFSLKNINIHAKINASECAEDGNLMIHGTDGHTTIISPPWLKERKVGETRSDFEINRIHWGSDVMKFLPKFEYDEVLNDDTALYQSMKCLKEYGLAWIKGAPRQSYELLNFGKRISIVRETFYGTVSRIESKPEAFFLGYTPKELALHTDFTYGSSIPGILIIHGIQCAPSGGKNLFVDGFKLAKDLKSNNLGAFELLSTGIMNYEMNGFESGTQFDHRCDTNVIRTNWRGDVDKIAFSDHTRTEYIMNIDVNDLLSYYEALKTFVDMAYSPEYLVQTMIEEGDMVMIDNFRLLHGRAAFEIKDGRGRHVESIYIDKDDFDSRLRVLGKHS